MKTLEEYRQLILGWARDRNLILGATPTKQLDKLFEELGEYAGADARSSIPEKREEMRLKMQDGLGDVFVVLVILAEQLGVEVDFERAVYDDSERATNAMLYLCAGCVAGLVAAIEAGYGDTDDEEFHFVSSFAVAKELATQHGFDYLECIGMAWNEIKDRKGRMVNGVFVKEADLA